jgi:hypothetical protein
MRPTTIPAEQERLNENAVKQIPLEKWGPYLSERQWGTVREDYSEGGDAWNYFPHDHAHCRAYRWGEDGLAGISDYFQNLCFAVALWNGKDPILKERLYGLANGEGNHGEDVKELYYYLDNVPTHYYMKYLYKYPQAAFPYEQIKNTNQHRSKQEVEFEILDTDVFKENKYFDVYVEYAKSSSEDIFIKIELVNRGTVAAPITVLPTLWFYNRWQYSSKARQKPCIEWLNDNTVKATHEKLGNNYLYFQNADDLLFTENETNTEKLFSKPNETPFVKDAFHTAIISGKNTKALRDRKQGTKCAPVYNLTVAGNSSKIIYLRLANHLYDSPFADGFENIFIQRKQEADEFYQAVLPKNKSDELSNIQRQAFAGLLWSKQFYHYDVERWISTSDGITPVSTQRLNGRNHTWKYLKNQDIIMPDKWEYPWYAAWDAAFHCIAMSIVDPSFAKNQLILLTREWYMNPSGQIPAYEWNFSDVNPPVHAFAALQVYHREKEMKGVGDIQFLKRIFQKLIINFTWWINRKDENGNNIFGGGFLGLDNIGVFNRSINEHHDDVSLEQADGTSWMGMYALNMMDMALEIAMTDNSFEDAATKFYEHFVIIGEALNELGLWNEEDNFFYDVLSLQNQTPVPLKVRSIVGAAPLFAVSIIDKKSLAALNDFRKRTNWFDNYRINNNLFLPNEETSDGNDQLLSLVLKERLIEILDKLLDENEFLSPGGIRALSKFHLSHPYSIHLKDTDYSIQYDPGDSTSDFYGGNSNWRGPVWMPINYLIIKAIKKYGEFYGDDLQVECPKGSGKMMNLKDVAAELTRRIISIFEKDSKGNRATHGEYNWFYQLPENNNLLLFHEYFHGDTASGLGASHQTGWTAVLVDLIRE